MANHMKNILADRNSLTFSHGRNTDEWRSFPVTRYGRGFLLGGLVTSVSGDDWTTISSESSDEFILETIRKPPQTVGRPS